jgi:hypothetical protein
MTTGFLKRNGQITREPSILDLTESTAPGNDSGVGKFYASSSDNKPRFVASTGTDYDLTVGAPGGSDTQVQFNNTNALDGDSEFTFNYTNKWLGIGNSSPTDRLTLSSDSGANDGTLTIHRGGVIGGPYLKLKRSRGTYVLPTVLSNNDTIANIAMQGYDGSDYNYGALISAVASENWTGSARGTKLEFGVVENGSTTLTTRFRIEPEGSLWMDQISIPSTTTDKLYNVSGDLFWDGFQLNTGGVRVDNVDVDSPSEVVDSFAETVCTGAYWHYVISKGSNYRTGLVNACWNPDTDEVAYRVVSTVDLGDTSDVTFSVDVSSNIVRLIATVASDNWSVRTKRFFIDD